MRMELGTIGEIRAAQYLESKQYRILCRNYRCKLGEIDLIAMDGETLCFVEVKTRRTLRHGLPCEAVNRQKLQHIHRCAQQYLSRHRIPCESIRVDVVEVLYRRRKFYCRLIRNVGG